MKQARYAAECLGISGWQPSITPTSRLRFAAIPTWSIHRIIREVLTETSFPQRIEQLNAKLPESAEQSSKRERIAVEAERETDDLKKAEFMLDRIGEEFEGLISGVTSFGIFVELENTVEGMVHVSYMNDDYYHYDDQYIRLYGERTGKVYRIGDRVKVRVTKVKSTSRKVDFELVAKEEAEEEPRKKREAGPKGKKARPPEGAGGRATEGKKGRKKKTGLNVLPEAPPPC